MKRILGGVPIFTGIAFAVPAFLKSSNPRASLTGPPRTTCRAVSLSLSPSHSHTFARSQGSSDVLRTVSSARAVVVRESVWLVPYVSACLILILTLNMINDWRRLAVGLLLSAASVLGSPVRVRSPYAVKDTHRVPMKWTQIGVPSADHMVRLTIGLKQTRFDELERHLQEGN
jgi:hypothetical protein